MGKNPAFQFYPSDWARDLEEHPLEIEGAWIRICCKLWWAEKRGEQTKTLTQWARILRCDEDTADKIIRYIENERIGDVFRNGNGNVTLMSRRMARDEKIRELTRLRVYKHRNKKACNAGVTQKKQRSSSSSSYTKVHIDLNDLPEWLPKDLWLDFIEHRNKLRKPMTFKAEELLLKKLTWFKDQGHNPKHLLMTSIERGWLSVFEPKEE